MLVSKKMSRETEDTVKCPENDDLPDHLDQLPRLARIAGQIEGVKKMIEERRPCEEIITQIRAIRSALKSVKGNIFAKHLTSCVATTLAAKTQDERGKHADYIVKMLKGHDD